VFSLIRLAAGFLAFSGGMTFFVYGLAQSIANGSCGTDEDGVSVGPPCPDGMGWLILLMIVGAFVAVLGAIAAAWGRLAVGLALGASAAIAVVAAIVFGVVDLNPDDTRPGLEVIVAAIGPALLFSLPALARH
jgi:hypothetical protein